jgi:hypothetical protein
LREAPAECSQLRGCATSFEPAQRPHRHPSRRCGFTPTCSDPDTSCRSLASTAVRSGQQQLTVRIPAAPFEGCRARPLPARTVACAVWENQLAGLTVPKHGSPLRALSCGLSRKLPQTTAPEVPSTSKTRPSRRSGERPSWLRSPFTRQATSTPLLPASTRTLDGVSVVRRAGQPGSKGR